MNIKESVRNSFKTNYHKASEMDSRISEVNYYDEFKKEFDSNCIEFNHNPTLK